MNTQHDDGRPVVVNSPGTGRAALPTRRPFGEVTAGPSRPASPAVPPDEQPDDDPPPDSRQDLAAKLAAELAERTADLQRIQADYANYRKRVRRDRLAVGEIAVANVLDRLLPVLDALDAARAQGELVGGLGAVAEVLEAELAGLGLQAFGGPGEPFDPERHEAVARVESAEVTGPVCTEILRLGYLVGDHLLRPAEVVVAEPLP